MITELTNSWEKEWDNFVQSNKCSYYFKISWRDVIHQNFNHQYKYYIHTDENGKIDGILPLFVIKSFLGTKLISIPYCPYGGVISKDEMVIDLLIAKAIEIGKSLNAKYIELKETSATYPNFIESSSYLTFKLNLSYPILEIWSNLSKSTKRKIKNSEKVETRITIDSNIEVFYRLYLKHLKKMGTPAIKFSFFENLIKKDPTNVKVATIWYEGIAASSILLLETDAGVIYDRGATNYGLRFLNLNYKLFWEIIKHYNKLEMNSFDFGRSVEESGTFQFKNSWRPNIIKLQYQYYLYNGSPINHSQSSWKRKVITKILKSLPRIEYIDNYLRKLYP